MLRSRPPPLPLRPLPSIRYNPAARGVTTTQTPGTSPLPTSLARTMGGGLRREMAARLFRSGEGVAGDTLARLREGLEGKFSGELIPQRLRCGPIAPQGKRRMREGGNSNAILYIYIPIKSRNLNSLGVIYNDPALPHAMSTGMPLYFPLYDTALPPRGSWLQPTRQVQGRGANSLEANSVSTRNEANLQWENKRG